MLEGYGETIREMTQGISDKRERSLKVGMLLRLIEKLEPQEDEYIASLFIPLREHLEKTLVQGSSPRFYRKQFSAIQKQVERQFGFVPAGSIREQYTGTGLALGLALGAGVGTALGNTAVGVGVAIAIGMAFGARVGAKREQAAAEKGLLY